MINSKGFSIKDQLHFAKISGDNNPLHIDVTEVRRMLVGGPVVHGIHLLFWSLDTVLINFEERFQLVSISVSFNKPISLNEIVMIKYNWISNEKIKIYLISNNVKKTSINIVFSKCDLYEENKINIKCPKNISPKLVKTEN